MKIMILNYEYPPLGAGAANATKYLLREFSKYKNLHIDLVTSSVNGFRVEKIHDNITIHYLNIRKDSSKLHSQSNKDLLTYSYKAYFYAKKLMNDSKYDLCHAFFGIPCGYIAEKLGMPFIVSLRGSDVPFYSKKYWMLDKIFFKRLSKNIWGKANYVIANSIQLRDLALKSSPYQDIGVIHNGIDVKAFLPKKSYLSKNKIKILNVGRLIERKGLSYLIDAIRPIKDYVSIDFIGDGPLRKQLEILAKDLDVNFLGLIEHEKLTDLYNKYDIFVQPSFNEGMSNTVLEAMAAGLPLIVTDIGGTKELIHGNGFIVRMANSKDITEALMQYIVNKNLIEIHGRKSRKIVEKMTWKKVSMDYYNLYRNLCKDN